MRYLMFYSRRQMTETTHLSCGPGCLDFWGWMPSFWPGQVPLPETQTRCTPKIRLQPSFQGRNWKRLERACTFGTAQNRSLSCPGCCWLLLAVQRVVLCGPGASTFCPSLFPQANLWQKSSAAGFISGINA